MKNKRLQFLMADVSGGAEKVAQQILQSRIETENYLFFIKQRKLILICGEKRTEFGLVRGLKKIILTKFNVVISHFYLTHLLLCFMSIFLFRGSKKIFLIHSGYYPDTFSKLEQNIIHLLRSIFCRFQAADIVYTSGFSQSCHLKIGWPIGRIVRNISIVPKHVMLNWKNFTPTNDRKVTIGFVGRDHPDKGIDLLLAIMKAHKKCESVKFLSIITSVKADYSRLDLPNADFEVETNDIYTYLSNIDILLVPSRNESYPMIILEALNVGCIVIASRVGGISEIISNRLHLIDERNLSLWTKKISDLRKAGLPNRYDSAFAIVNDSAIDDYIKRLE